MVIALSRYTIKVIRSSFGLDTRLHKPVGRDIYKFLFSPRQAEFGVSGISIVTIGVGVSCILHHRQREVQSWTVSVVAGICGRLRKVGFHFFRSILEEFLFSFFFKVLWLTCFFVQLFGRHQAIQLGHSIPERCVLLIPGLTPTIPRVRAQWKIARRWVHESIFCLPWGYHVSIYRRASIQQCRRSEWHLDSRRSTLKKSTLNLRNPKKVLWNFEKSLKNMILDAIFQLTHSPTVLHGYLLSSLGQFCMFVQCWQVNPIFIDPAVFLVIEDGQGLLPVEIVELVRDSRKFWLDAVFFRICLIPLRWLLTIESGSIR